MAVDMVHHNLNSAPACSELQEVLGHIDAAYDAVALAEKQHKDAIQSLRGAALRYLMDADEDLLARADFVYWQMPDVPVGVIAAVMLGDAKKAPLVAAMLPNASPPGIDCPTCGDPMTFHSRSELQEWRADQRRGRDRYFKSTCAQCREIDAVEHAVEIDNLVDRQRERIHQLRAMPYKEYLLSEHWLETRNRKLKQARFQCQLCNAPWPLQVHHRTYERRGCEDMGDLTVLCRPCHAKFHDKLP